MVNLNKNKMMIFVFLSRYTLFQVQNLLRCTMRMQRIWNTFTCYFNERGNYGVLLQILDVIM